MRRLDLLLLKIFLYGIPVVALIMALCYFYDFGTLSHRNFYANLFNTFSGFVFALWMVLSLYLSFRLIVSGPFRDQVIARITFRRERDEREAMLTGKATRITFLTSLAFLVLLFCLSCFQVSIYRVPPEKAVNGKTGFLTLGLGFSFLDQAKEVPTGDALDKRDIFSYRGLPVSNATIILALIAWHILSYNYFMRRLMR
jgi:hypothetical protein